MKSLLRKTILIIALIFIGAFVFWQYTVHTDSPKNDEAIPKILLEN